MMRGQIVIEFLILVCIAVLIGIIYLGVGNELLHDTTEQQRLEALNSIGYAIQDEIILATLVQDGYQRSFIIPAKADRFVYAISNDDQSVTLTSGGLILTYDLPQVNGTLGQGMNLVAKNGEIRVN